MKPYKGFELFVNSVRMSFKMHVRIFTAAVVLHLLVLAGYSVFFFRKLDRNEKRQYEEVVERNLQQFKEPGNLLKGNISFSAYELPQKESFQAGRKLFYITFTSYLFYPVLLLFFASKTSERFKERTKRGAALVNEKTFAETLPVPVSIPISDSIKLPCDFETAHCFIGGSTGTGKTNLISGVIDHLQRRNEKLIVYDAKDGEFVAKFYDADTDLIFNPFDARSLHWNVFDAISNESDFDAVAASVVPQSYSREPFFNNAARDLLASILRYCHLNDMKTNGHVWQLLCKPLRELQELLLSINSEAAYHIENKDVINTLMQYAKIFRYLVNSGNKPEFSLHQWVRDDDKKGTIFLTNNAKQRQTLKGILSLFINSLANEVLSLADNPKRRIFIIVDEFGTLQKLESVKDLLALGRSKGCSFWIGIQEKAQLDETYSRNIANTIINQCNNYLVFRMNDSDSAEYFSRLFGEKEIEAMESTYSSGVEDHRDGESYRNVTRKERLVLPSEIQSIENLRFFAKFANSPVTQTAIRYKDFPIIEAPFINNEHFVAGQPKPAESSGTNTNTEKEKTAKAKDAFNPLLEKGRGVAG